jgi:hypothetical protein
MPTLDWLNREAAFRSAAQVPTRVLRPHTAAPCVGDAAAVQHNLLVQGDNLQALKALLPFYRGQVKCIFIDPPYNTKSAFEAGNLFDPEARTGRSDGPRRDPVDSLGRSSKDAGTLMRLEIVEPALDEVTNAI